MANEGIMLALGGLALFALFRRSGGTVAPSDPPNGGQIASIYGGSGSLNDFAAAATLRADEASGVGKGYLLNASTPWTSAGLMFGGSGIEEQSNLNTVPMLEISGDGGYLKIPENQPPAEVSGDEDIGIAPWTSAGLMFGGSNNDAAPTSVKISSNVAPVIEQHIYEVDVSSSGHVSEIAGAGESSFSVPSLVKTNPPIEAPADAIQVDTFPTLRNIGVSDNKWVEAHVEKSFQNIVAARKRQGAALPSAEYKERFFREQTAANLNLPVYQ